MPVPEWPLTPALQGTRGGALLQAVAAAGAEGGAGALRCLLLLQQLPTLQVMVACSTSTHHIY